MSRRNDANKDVLSKIHEQIVKDQNNDGVLVANLESVYITSIGRLVKSSISRNESSSRFRLLREVDVTISGCT